MKIPDRISYSTKAGMSRFTMISVNMLMTYINSVSASYPSNSTNSANIYGSRDRSNQSVSSGHRTVEEFHPLITVITDDVNDGRVKVSMCKNAIFMNCPITAGRKVHLNETVACLLHELDQLDEEGTCAMVFTSIIKNVFEACNSTGPEGLCFNITKIPNRPYNLEKLSDLTCFAQNYFADSSFCRDQLDDLIGDVIPCAAEAGKYCPRQSEDPMPCLNATHSNASVTDFSIGCIGLLSTWSLERNSDDSDTDDITDNDDNVWNAKQKTRDSLYLQDSTMGSRVLKGALQYSGVVLLINHMIFVPVLRLVATPQANSLL